MRTQDNGVLFPKVLNQLDFDNLVRVEARGRLIQINTGFMNQGLRKPTRCRYPFESSPMFF